LLAYNVVHRACIKCSRDNSRTHKPARISTMAKPSIVQLLGFLPVRIHGAIQSLASRTSHARTARLQPHRARNHQRLSALGIRPRRHEPRENRRNLRIPILASHGYSRIGSSQLGHELRNRLVDYRNSVGSQRIRQRNSLGARNRHALPVVAPKSARAGDGIRWGRCRNRNAYYVACNRVDGF